MKNLFISYDLRTPGQNYEAVVTAIKRLGSWAKIHDSYWYISSSHTLDDITSSLWSIMDRNDKLFVVDASSGVAAWRNLPEEVANHLRIEWTR